MCGFYRIAFVVAIVEVQRKYRLAHVKGMVFLLLFYLSQKAHQKEIVVFAQQEPSELMISVEEF